MNKTEFVYVVYIASTPERVFDALVNPEFTREYWAAENVSDWKPGSGWEHKASSGGRIMMVGKVVEFDRPRRLVLTWAEPSQAANAEAYSRVTLDVAQVNEMVRLTVTHDRLAEGSDMYRGISEGWPRVLSSLKSMLETGKPLPTWAGKK